MEENNKEVVQTEGKKVADMTAEEKASYNRMKTAEKKEKMKKMGRTLIDGKKCPDYPELKECGVRCQNCRFNRFVDGNPSWQVCVPHTVEEAQKKGPADHKPESYLRDHMDMVRRHEAERVMAERAAKEAAMLIGEAEAAAGVEEREVTDNGF